MHLRVNLKFFGEILVHPVRRQNFAGTGAPYILQHLRLCRKQFWIHNKFLTDDNDHKSPPLKRNDGLSELLNHMNAAPLQSHHLAIIGIIVYRLHGNKYWVGKIELPYNNGKLHYYKAQRCSCIKHSFRLPFQNLRYGSPPGGDWIKERICEKK